MNFRINILAMGALLAFANGIQAAKPKDNIHTRAVSNPMDIIAANIKANPKQLTSTQKKALRTAIENVIAKATTFSNELINQLELAIAILGRAGYVGDLTKLLSKISGSATVKAKPTAGVTSAATKGKTEKEKVASDIKRRTALSAAGTDFAESALGTVAARSASGSVASAAASDFEGPSKEATEASDAALATLKRERIRNRRGAVDANPAQSAAAAEQVAQPAQVDEAALVALYKTREARLTPIMKHVAENLENLGLASIRGAVGAIHTALNNCPERPALYLYYKNIPSFAEMVHNLAYRLDRVVADKKALSESLFSAYKNVQQYNKEFARNPIDFNQKLDLARQRFLVNMGIVSLALLDELTKTLALLPAGNQGAPSAAATAASAN